MRSLWGLGIFGIVVTFLAGATLAETVKPDDRVDEKALDQPVDKTKDGVEEPPDPGEDPLPDPPPYFGEVPNAGERMKIVWCLDRSGSMGSPGGGFTGPDGEPTTGSRWDRARVETARSLLLLTPEWEFGIVTYACNRDRFKPELVKADPANITDAIAWLNGHFPLGGTGTGPAQAEAFRLADGGVQGSATCWLLSDGQPNCGASGTTGHKAMALAANTQGHVLNTVGIADFGEFAAFMMELAAETGGIYVHVQ